MRTVYCTKVNRNCSEPGG